jgi:hypothetical protein
MKHFVKGGNHVSNDIRIWWVLHVFVKYWINNYYHILFNILKSHVTSVSLYLKTNSTQNEKFSKWIKFSNSFSFELEVQIFPEVFGNRCRYQIFTRPLFEKYPSYHYLYKSPNCSPSILVERSTYFFQKQK